MNMNTLYKHLRLWLLLSKDDFHVKTSKKFQSWYQKGKTHIIYCGLLSFYEFMALLSPHITDNIASFISFSEADGRATDLGHQVLVRKEP